MISVENSGIKKALVVRMGSIGDVILTTPVIEALAERCPRASIDFLTKKEYADLVKNHPALGKVWGFDPGSGFRGLLDLCTDIKSSEYDLLMDLHRNLRSTIVRALAGARINTAYNKHTLKRLLLKWLRINLLKGAPPVADRYFSALSGLGISREGRLPRLFIDPESQSSADAMLERTCVRKSGRLIGVAPGARHATKRWPAERFAHAAHQLGGHDSHVVMIGGPGDIEVAALVSSELESLGTPCADLSGRTTLLETAAVISRLSLLLTNDSGVMHMGDALSVPMVAVFGPTTRELGFYPLGALSAVAEAEGVSCRPCSLHGDSRCPKMHHKCMYDLEVGPVVIAAREVESMAQKGAGETAHSRPEAREQIKRGNA